MKSAAPSPLLPLVIAIALAALPGAALPQTDALDMSLEELLTAEVTAASRKAQRLNDVAAAAFIISREDIERSGATSIPEALRMAPGVQVGRLSNNRWAVSVRGFNGRFSNKLQVLMDGRSIYSPLFSGVVWEAEDTSLADIDRIEVIRGPGAAMWGANAVNGVINIVTRRARDTQGDLVELGVGTSERAFGTVRHGGQVADGFFRAWAKGFAREKSSDLAAQRANDDWQAGRVGFRADWGLASGNRLTLNGGAHMGREGDRWNIPDVTSPSGFMPTDMQQKTQGWHLVGRYEWIMPGGSDAALQMYLDYSDVDIENAVREQRTTADLDFQHRFQIGRRHDFVWGLGYRHSHDQIGAQGMIRVQPDSRNFRLLSAFVQDDITFVPDTLRLMLGARLEHNSFTGFEPQPNARLIWTPSPNHALWGAVSRAVRTPSRAELDAQVDLSAAPAHSARNPTPFPILIRNVPRADHQLSAERVTAFELGYRHQFQSGLSVDLTAFHNRYSGLRSSALGGAYPESSTVPYLLQTVVPNNDIEARTRGLELALDWRVSPEWRLQPSYSYLRIAAHATTGDPVNRMNAQAFERDAPRHQFSLRSSMSFSGQRQLDVWLRHVSKLGDADMAGNGIPAYTTMDVRYAWRPTKSLELSVVGQNLLDQRHPEFVPVLIPSETLQVERGVYLKAKWQF